MPFTLADVEEELAHTPEEIPGSYTDRDALLYAVAIGMSRDPYDQKELEYTCESVGNRVVPTAATVLTKPSRRPSGDRKPLMSKINFALMLHGEQRLTVHQPLPQSANTALQVDLQQTVPACRCQVADSHPTDFVPGCIEHNLPIHSFSIFEVGIWAISSLSSSSVMFCSSGVSSIVPCLMKLV